MKTRRTERTVRKGETPRYASAVVALAIVAFFWRQRRKPIPLPPFLTFLIENPIIERFAGAHVVLARLDLTPSMKVLDAGCGPGRLTIPVAKTVGSGGRVVALDSQPAMLRKLEERFDAEDLKNVRPLRGDLGGRTLDEGDFDRVLLAMALGEVRDKKAALRELYGVLKPGGILSITEIFGDPDYRRPANVRRETEVAGFRLVERFGGFPAYTLNFEKPQD